MNVIQVRAKINKKLLSLALYLYQLVLVPINKIILHSSFHTQLYMYINGSLSKVLDISVLKILKIVHCDFNSFIT